MTLKSRTVTIKWKLNPDAFALINKKELNSITRKLGSAQKAVSTILLKEQLMDILMPHIINLNPTDFEYKKKITNYWDSLSVDIDEDGKKLEIGFDFDMNNDHKIRKPYIESFLKQNKVNNNEEFANKIVNTIPIEEQYRYGVPIKIEDYLLYIYCQDFRDVANTPNDINKSTFIRFYIEDEEQVKVQRNELVKLSIKAQEKLINVLKDEKAPTLIYNLLCVLEPTEISTINTLDNDGQRNRLWDIAGKSPEEFINLANDKNLHKRALIEKLLNKTILRKMPNTDIITDVEDPSIVIGNTMELAISWFSLEENKAKISEYEIRLKEAK